MLFQIWFVCATLFVLLVSSNAPIALAQTQPTQPPITLPIISAPQSAATTIAAGGFHACALTTSGGIKCWGLNSYGELGDGTTTTPRTTPVDVSGLSSGATRIAAGDFHTCALTTSGGVKCWGNNDTGQLGIGTPTQPLTAPVDVSGLSSGVSSIAASSLHTCALTTSGGVKCWGWNLYGQLGDGTTTDRYSPVDVSGMTSGVNAIAVGGNRTCALTTNGGVKCWGWNLYGQLGDGTTTDRYTPVDVIGLTSSVSAIAGGGDFHTCALMTSGGVKCWGLNTSYQLGDGTTTDRYTPVDVIGLTQYITDLSLFVLCKVLACLFRAYFHAKCSEIDSKS